MEHLLPLRAYIETSMSLWIANCLVILGAAILIACIPPVRMLLLKLPHGSLRGWWSIMTGLILIFIAGYIVYIWIHWRHPRDASDLIVSNLFFLGACFVWLSCILSLRTVQDAHRLAHLEQESITDPLSGVYNRRYLDRRLEEEFARAQRYQTPLSIMLLDIDHFKLINDTFGHLAGDQILGDLGRLAQNTIRVSDILARFGGDEFMIVAPNTSLEMAGILAERLRRRIEKHSLFLGMDAHTSQEIRLRVSIGVSVSEPGLDLRGLINNADQALYCAKLEGRDRVVLFPGNCIPPDTPLPHHTDREQR